MFNTEPWLTQTSMLKRAPKMTSIKPFKWENQLSNQYKNMKQETLMTHINISDGVRDLLEFI